ncbi:MAG TPA: hypothetical protein VHY37_05885 [Tepidisphaeraceae bacterium]|nr:hypothetical protein [Tepidisphaeraceae bacterium]
MKSGAIIGLLLASFFCVAAVSATQPAAATQPSAAQLAIAKPLLAEADKQALALGDQLAASVGTRLWLDAHLRAGDWPVAQKIIESTPPQSHARLYELACVTAAMLGDVKLARRMLDEQLKDDPTRNQYVAYIAAADARGGDITAATADINSLADPTNRKTALYALAIAQQKAGNHAEAVNSCREYLKLAQTERGIIGQFDVELGFRRMAEIGEVDAAKQLASYVKDDKHRARDFEAIAQGRAIAGDIDGYIASLSFPLDANETGETLLPASELARRGDVAGAQRLLKLCSDSAYAGIVRAQIAFAQIRRGDIPAALATAENLASLPNFQLIVYLEIIRAQTLAGDAKGAAKTLDLARKGMDRAHGWDAESTATWLAYSQAASGDAAGAISTISSIKADPSRLLLFYSIATQIELAPPNALLTLANGLL